MEAERIIYEGKGFGGGRVKEKSPVAREWKEARC